MNLIKLLHLLLTFKSLIPRSETQLNDAVGRGLAKFVSEEPLANRTGKSFPIIDVCVSLFKLFVQREIFSKYFIVPLCVFMDSLIFKKPLYRITARVSHNVNHPLKSNENTVKRKNFVLDGLVSIGRSVFKKHIKEKIIKRIDTFESKTFKCYSVGILN